jgi:hypothetical protein
MARGVGPLLVVPLSGKKPCPFCVVDDRVLGGLVRELVVRVRGLRHRLPMGADVRLNLLRRQQPSDLVGIELGLRDGYLARNPALIVVLAQSCALRLPPV